MSSFFMSAAIIAFAIVMLGMPSLIRLAVQKNLLDEPLEDRKVHRRSVPRLGGVLIFIATLVTTTAMVNPEGAAAVGFLRLAAGTTMLFFLGLKDDLSSLDPLKKLGVQISVGLILILGGGFAIEDFGGLFGFHAISPAASVLFSLFVYIVVVNAINLIDGIDTLASGYGLLATIAGAIWFELTGQPDLAILCMALSGALAGFIVFNISPARIFLGDSGSLVLGMMLYVIASGIISTPTELVPNMWEHRSMPVLAMTLLSYPLVDTLRVFTLRLAQGRSPFSPDSLHIHHRMLGIGMTHLQAALTIHLYTAGMVALGFCMPAMDPTIAFVILLSAAFLLPAAVWTLDKLMGFAKVHPAVHTS